MKGPLDLKRIAPGYYVTRDGRWEIARTTYPHNGEIAWYWRPVDGDANDHHATKRQAVEALRGWLAPLAHAS